MTTTMVVRTGRVAMACVGFTLQSCRKPLYNACLRRCSPSALRCLSHQAIVDWDDDRARRQWVDAFRAQPLYPGM